MLRIHFTSEDLVRTRISTTWGPLGETFFGLMTLQQPNAGAMFGGWRRRANHESVAPAHPASELFREAALDLFTVTGQAESVDAGLEALRAASADHLQAELISAVESRARYWDRTTPWAGTAWGDPAHDREDRRELVDFLADFHRVAVAPYWPRIEARLRAEHTGHARTFAEHGVEAMLAGLPPGFRWRSPVLEIGRGPVVGDVKLDGRGLLLVPSAFCRTRAMTYNSLVDDQSPVILFMPVVRTVSDAAALLTVPGSGTLKRLVALLGRTRAHALDAIGHGPCTTGQLAERLAASPATASEHATVLREAGLIATTRHGSAVLHALTPLGEALLNGESTPSGRGV
ncbi:ArsR/SmtB family transcription factor [Streptomyces sp. NPDC056672]|uniref:ArsR/SmtB family transcription factor n=1 Tax=Streptomyces sp. NPDC056672 TaxID=3345906 RepID=UPI00369D16E0